MRQENPTAIDASSEEIIPVTTNAKKSQLIFVGIFIVALLAVFFIFNILTQGNFLEWSNLKIILSNMVYPSFMAWGMCFIFACGYNDMSWGAVVVLGSFATGVFGNEFGIIGVIVGGLVVGFALVLLNFCIFAFTKIPSWIASLGLAMVYEAIAVFLRVSKTTGSLVDAPLIKELRFLGQLPYSWIILVVGFLIIYFIYNQTTIGFNIRSLGGNSKIATSFGVNLNKTLLFVGIICGILIGITSVLQESYTGYTTVKTGLTSIFLLFQPLAIALLAEILQKKINIIIAVPICAFLMYSVFNLLTIMHVPSGTLQEALLCAFIIAFGLIGQRGVKGVVK